MRIPNIIWVGGVNNIYIYNAKCRDGRWALGPPLDPLLVGIHGLYRWIWVKERDSIVR